MSSSFVKQKASLILTISASLLLCACNKTGESNDRPELWQSHITAGDIKDEEVFVRETIYVPSYSCIYFENRARKLELAETLSFRNTDQKGTLYLRSVNYYGSDGKLVKKYLASPVAIGPLCTAEFVVPRLSTEAGSGANFIAEWVASAPVSDPIAESVMVSSGLSRNLSFVSRGVTLSKVVKAVR